MDGHNNHHILRWYEWGLLFFVNKHLSSWPLLGLKGTEIDIEDIPLRSLS